MALTEHLWPQMLEKIIEGQNLSTSDAKSLMKGWLDEELTAVQTGAFLSVLRVKGVTGEELAAMANVLREVSLLPCSIPSIPLVDTCGTGGDGADTFNISTAVAFTAAACGANVAKHGNRSASGKVGSADVLEALGLQLKAPLEKVVGALSITGITFLFAPAWHPALVNLAPLRKSLGIRTVFNLLGPLVNPLRPASQVLGVAKPELLDPMAEALQQIGLKRAVVVHGEGGIDEASLEGETSLRLVEDGKIRAMSLSSASLGLPNASLEELKGGDLLTNQEILTSVLKGASTGPQMDVVALNTSLVLWAAGIKEDFADGLIMARNCLSDGRPWKKLQELRQTLDS